MAIRYWLRHPRLALARISYAIWELRNPDKPWMCPGTIAFCESHLTREMTGLEFGSGRSTRWFSAKLAHLVSVEHDADWSAQVRRQLADAGITNVDYRHVPLEHPPDEPERVAYDPTPSYVAVADSLPDRSLGLAIVDGHYRTTCVRHVIPKVQSGGYLLVDDVNMWPSLAAIPVPTTWRVADDSTNGVKRCVIWQAP